MGHEPLADEVGHDFGFCCRGIDARFFAGFDAFQGVRHLLELGKAVLAASDARHESRGSASLLRLS